VIQENGNIRASIRSRTHTYCVRAAEPML
jgi:hypothetical protein